LGRTLGGNAFRKGLPLDNWPKIAQKPFSGASDTCSGNRCIAADGLLKISFVSKFSAPRSEYRTAISPRVFSRYARG
jgi:hypothetical protein